MYKRQLLALGRGFLGGGGHAAQGEQGAGRDEHEQREGEAKIHGQITSGQGSRLAEQEGTESRRERAMVAARSGPPAG